MWELNRVNILCWILFKLYVIVLSLSISHKFKQKYTMYVTFANKCWRWPVHLTHPSTGLKIHAQHLLWWKKGWALEVLNKETQWKPTRPVCTGLIQHKMLTLFNSHIIPISVIGHGGQIAPMFWVRPPPTQNRGSAPGVSYFFWECMFGWEVGKQGVDQCVKVATFLNSCRCIPLQTGQSIIGFHKLHNNSSQRSLGAEWVLRPTLSDPQNDRHYFLRDNKWSWHFSGCSRMSLGNIALNKTI